MHPTPLHLDKKPFYIAIPSIADRSLVLEGSEDESLWVYIGAVPLKLAEAAAGRTSNRATTSASSTSPRATHRDSAT
jgi:hypothetical protein